MVFRDEILADTVLLRVAIQSADFVPGVSGWAIYQDGTAEFNSLTARGSIVAGSISTSALETVARLLIDPTFPNQILFYAPDQPNSTPVDQLARIIGSPNSGMNNELKLRAYGTEAAVELTQILLSGTPNGFIEINAEERVNVFSVGNNNFKSNGFDVMASNHIQVIEMAPSASPALTSVYADVANFDGSFVTVRPNAQLIVIGSFDFTVTTPIGAGGLATAQLVINSGAQADTPYVDANFAHREMTTGVWRATLGVAGLRNVKFQARKSINAGAVTLNSSLSKAVALVLDIGV